MQLTRMLTLLVCSFMSLMSVAGTPSSQEPVFELPVQLVGFPVIIAAVRISNFVKKLAYSLSPETYKSRMKRDLSRLTYEENLDVEEVEKKIVADIGNNVCVYERICTKYAENMLRKKGKHDLKWDVVFSQYKSSPESMKNNYLLSVFLGHVVGSPKLCHQLAKRRACNKNNFLD